MEMLFRVVIIALLFSAPLEAFKSLAEAQTFAKAFAENEDMKYDVRQFRDLIVGAVNQRENVGYIGRYVVKITPYPGSQFVIWGPVKGSFKSLVRCLTYLQQKNMLGDDFKIKTPDTYFVFVGDVLNGTEHVMEALTLVLSLMKANPSTVIYIRGHREDFLHWQNNGLKKSLKKHARSLSSETIPLGRTVTHFFNTLPLALYLTGENPQDGLVRLSYFGGDNSELEERACPALTTSRFVNVPELCSLSITERAPLLVKAIIKAETRVMSYKYYHGLALTEPDRGATAWATFSSPTSAYQRDYQFYYDSFSILTTAARLEDFRITPYNRDMRGLDPFHKGATYNLLTGEKVKELKHAGPSLSPEALSRKIEELQKKIKLLARDVVNYRRAVYTLPVKGE